MNQQLEKTEHEYWHKFKSAEKLLQECKSNGITNGKLDKVVFGNTAKGVLKALRKHGEPAFEELKKEYQMYYCMGVALAECVKKNTINN